MKLDGKVAIITGGGRGIGRETALLFAREGARVTVTARTFEQVARVADEILMNGGEAVAIPADVSNEEAVREMVEKTIDKFEKVDILVNNAGIANVGPFVAFDSKDWREVIEVNLMGAFYCAKAVVPTMLENGWGRIINVASRSGKIGFPYETAYCASKHGMVGLTKALAEELASFNITVNAICPGATDTDMVPEVVKERLIGEIIKPSQVADLALYLAGENAAAINGEAINIFGNNRMDVSM